MGNARCELGLALMFSVFIQIGTAAMQYNPYGKALCSLLLLPLLILPIYRENCFPPKV